MSDEKCPGRDTMKWGPDSAFEVDCPKCGATMEFFKDEAFRMCKCGAKVENPRMDLGVSYKKEKDRK